MIDHPQLEEGITFVLYPYIKEIINNVNDMVVSRAQLDEFISQVQQEHPKIKFDTSLMDQFEHSNTWWIEIMQDEGLKKELLDKINDGPGPDDMNHIYEVVLGKYAEGMGVEGNDGVYNRV